MGEGSGNQQPGGQKGRSLWQHPDFLKLWAGQSLSEIGTSVTQLALPTTAILLLGAGPFTVGLINTLPAAAYLVLGLLAGAAVDRLRRRPVLILSDTLRLIALLAIPLTYAHHLLRVWHLPLIALVVGIGSVFFEVAYHSYLPGLVGRDHLLEGNARLQTSRSVAQVAGPSLAGILIQAVGAALAILADALSYAMSIATLLWIRAPEPLPSVSPNGKRHALRRITGDVSEGLTVALSDKIVRGTTFAVTMSNTGWQIVWAVLLVYAYRSLGLTPAAVGGVFALASVLSVIGALAAPTLVDRLGPGRLMVIALSLNALGELLLPLARVAYPLLVFAAAALLNAALTPAFNITVRSLRQSLIASHLLGRTNATVRTMNQAGVMLGALAGGFLGSRLGILPTFIIGAGVTLSGITWLSSGPTSLRRLPTSGTEPPLSNPD